MACKLLGGRLIDIKSKPVRKLRGCNHDINWNEGLTSLKPVGNDRIDEYVSLAHTVLTTIFCQIIHKNIKIRHCPSVHKRMGNSPFFGVDGIYIVYMGNNNYVVPF